MSANFFLTFGKIGITISFRKIFFIKGVGYYGTGTWKSVN